jgi:hypothetical protein
MSTVYIILINLILLFIFFVVLNHKINKNSTSTLLDRYAKEMEELVVALNRTVDDLLNLSEERIEELKKLIKRAERLLKNKEVKASLTFGHGEKDVASEKDAAQSAGSKSLMEKTGHLLAMGHSKDEIAKILKINRAEVDFLEALLGKG